MNPTIKSDFDKVKEYVNKKRTFGKPSKDVNTGLDRIEWYVERLESVVSVETTNTLKEIISALEYDAKNKILMSPTTAEEITIVLKKIISSIEVM